MENSAKKTRSPNYPSISLETAVEKVTKFYEKSKKHPATIELTTQFMGYKKHSSTGLQAVAALKAFGLIDYVGPAGQRQAQVSERATKIILGHSEKKQLLREAALFPAMNSEVWSRFYTHENGLANDELIRQYLLFDRIEGRFNEDAIPVFIAQLKNSVKYAELDTKSPAESSTSELNEERSSYVASTTQDVGTTLQKSDAAPPLSINEKGDVFAVSSGKVSVRWPTNLTPDDVLDIQEYWPILLRKIVRSVQLKATESGGESEFR